MKIKFTLFALALGLSAVTQASAGDIYMSTLVQGHFNRVDARVEMRGHGILQTQRAQTQAVAPSARRASHIIVTPSRITSLTIGGNNSTWIDSRGHAQRVHAETRGHHNTTSIRLRSD